MWERIIAYFAERHLLCNLIFLLIIFGGMNAWRHTQKEELPAITFDTARISVSYPGAPAEDVEYFITRPIEEALRAVDGVFRIYSTSGTASASIFAELEPGIDNIDEVVTEIRSTVLDVDLPEEVRSDPTVRVWKTNKKAVLDIALVHSHHRLLDKDGRRELQNFALAFENQLLNLPEVHSVNKRGFRQEELRVEVYPDRLLKYEIPFNTAMQKIRSNNIRKPAGTLQIEKEPKVTLLSELNSVEKLQDLIIQGGFEGQVIRLRDVAEVKADFAHSDTVFKVNGREAVMFSAVKSPAYGILDTLDAITAFVDRFQTSNLEGMPVQVYLLDDESIDIRNRLHIISVNGAIGFALILVTLFIFLDKRSGLWVALGIPFTFCSTMLFASLLGYSVNGITLAAVIIVMGMVVDDAIVVAENIARLIQQGIPRKQAVVDGTAFVLMPIVASILTTCVAFLPLFFFGDRWGRVIAFIPPVIFLMLAASLFESIFILPGHMSIRLPRERDSGMPREHWFVRVENLYGRLLEWLLRARWLVLLGFIALAWTSSSLVGTKIKYVMFPHEETRDIVLNGKVTAGSTRYQTAEKVQAIEDILLPRMEDMVVGFRTRIARERGDQAVEENKFNMLIEIVPREQRKVSADDIVTDLQKQIETLPGFEELRFRKSRWGHASGSPIELLVQQNDDEQRHAIVNRIAEAMRADPNLQNVELDEGSRTSEFRIDIDRESLTRLSIDPGDVASTLRAGLEGSVLYEFSDGDKEIDLRFTTVKEARDDIDKVLNLPVENRNNYLVPLRSVVTVEEVTAPTTISRQDLKRTSKIFADFHPDQNVTPLQVAVHYETEVFPGILADYPTTALSFGGEVEETRRSKKQFQNAVTMALALIFVILALLFNSLIRPIIVMLAIPFGVVGVILAFYLHGKVMFGFYAAIGALGLAGVVVNDSIIMLVKLEKMFDVSKAPRERNRQIADTAKTRLRAVLLTTLTTVAGVLPTAYGLAGYDAMLAEMMLALAWGLIFATLITLVLVPCLYSMERQARDWFRQGGR